MAVLRQTKCDYYHNFIQDNKRDEPKFWRHKYCLRSSTALIICTAFGLKVTKKNYLVLQQTY